MVSESELREILEEFVKSAGVIGAAIVSNEGLMMCSLLPEDSDPNLVAAMSASLFGTSRKVVEELNLGPLQQAIVEAREGKLVACSAGKYGILVSLVPHTTNIGLVILELGKTSERIRRLLEE